MGRKLLSQISTARRDAGATCREWLRSSQLSGPEVRQALLSERLWRHRWADLRQNMSSTAQPVISGQKIYPLRFNVPDVPFSFHSLFRLRASVGAGFWRIVPVAVPHRSVQIRVYCCSATGAPSWQPVRFGLALAAHGLGARSRWRSLDVLRDQRNRMFFEH